MTNELWRSSLVSLGVSLGLLGMSLVAACSSPSTDSSKDMDVCAATAGQAVVAGGTAELGTGNAFTAIPTGGTVDVVAGSQGLHMFVINMRVRDLDVSLDKGAAVTVSVHDQNGVSLAMDFGCRARFFEPNADGWLYADQPYNQPLTLDALARIDGTMVTLQIDVRDDQGHEATDMRTVVAHVVP